MSNKIELIKDPKYNFICELNSWEDDYHGSFRIGAFGWYIRIQTPDWLLQPHKEKVKAIGWDETTIKRLGRDWYYDIYHRSFGINWFDTYITILYGYQTNCWPRTNVMSFNAAWIDYTYCKYKLFTPDWKEVYSNDGEYDSQRWSQSYDYIKQIIDEMPKEKFVFNDYDGEEIVAECYIEYRRWHLGRKPFRWLKWFSKPLERYTIDIHFNKETGNRKDTWKGGTICSSQVMKYGDSIESAFIEYSKKNKFTNVRKLDCPID